MTADSSSRRSSRPSLRQSERQLQWALAQRSPRARLLYLERRVLEWGPLGSLLGGRSRILDGPACAATARRSLHMRRVT